MEKIDLSGHQRGILKLTGRTVIAPFECVFGMKIVYCQGKKKKDQQKSDMRIFSGWLVHRIPSLDNIRKNVEESQLC